MNGDALKRVGLVELTWGEWAIALHGMGLVPWDFANWDSD